MARTTMPARFSVWLARRRAAYRSTRALPVQVLKILAPKLMALMGRKQE